MYNTISIFENDVGIMKLCLQSIFFSRFLYLLTKPSILPYCGHKATYRLMGVHKKVPSSQNQNYIDHINYFIHRLQANHLYLKLNLLLVHHFSSRYDDDLDCCHLVLSRRGTTSATPKRWTTASMKKFVEVTPMTHRRVYLSILISLWAES